MSADLYRPPLRIELKRDFPEIKQHRGNSVALAVSQLGVIYTLLSEPSRLIKYNLIDNTIVEMSRGLQSYPRPSELFTDNWRDIFIVDPLNNSILRLDSRLNILTPIVLQDNSSEIEPLSICRDLSYGIYLISRTNPNLWKLDYSGKLVTLQNVTSDSMRLKDPKRIRFSDYIDRLLVLDENMLKAYNRFGYPDFTIKLTVVSPTAFSVSGREVWISGNGLSCVDLHLRREIYTLSTDSLAVLIPGTPVDISAGLPDRFYLQTDKNNTISSFTIIRQPGD